MENKKFLSVGILLIATVFLTGCIKFGPKDISGGVFKSEDKGETWTQKIFVSKTDKRTTTIGQVDVLTMAFDPQDSKTIYIGTGGNGMYATDDRGEIWSPVFTDQGQVGKITVDPKNRKIIYAAKHNQIFKTADQGAKWELIYVESEPGQYITDLAIDSYDPKKIYAALSGGKLIRSDNQGQSWKVIKNFENKIEKIMINKKDTRIIYIATQHSGLFRTSDLGENWQSLAQSMSKYSGSHVYQAAIFDQTKKDSILYVSNFGLLKSDDGGKTWQEIKLLAPPAQMKIFSMAINPKESKEIYYSTASALYKTTDEGESWVTKSLPSARAANYLLLDPNNSKILYMGTLKIK